MKIIKTIRLAKYEDDSAYTDCGKNIFKSTDDNSYFITLYCELGKNEDLQFPLEALLDRYYLNCTDYMEVFEENGKRICVVELESGLGDEAEDYENILSVLNVIGKNIK